MNTNAVYIPLSITRNKMDYYAMLHYSFKTLHQYYNGEFDIVVSVSSADFNIWDEDYMGMNLIKDFPLVKFFKSDYHIFSPNPLMHKWYDVDKVFKMGYELVFCFDCDIKYFNNIDYFFEKYNDGNLYALFEGDNDHFIKVLGRNGMAGGQIMFPKHIFENIPNLNDKVVETQKQLITKAYEVLDFDNARWFETLSEQYAIQSVFINSGYTPKSLSCNDVCFGREVYDIEYLENDVKIIANVTALHYLGSCNWLFLPKEYLTPFQYERKLQIIQKNNIKGNLK
jgi:hypothetical protein